MAEVEFLFKAGVEVREVLGKIDELRSNKEDWIRVIRGHLAGVENMIQSQKPHQDILTQLSAIRSAVHKVALLEAQRYVESVTNSADERNTSKTDITDAINKLMDLQLAAL